MQNKLTVIIVGLCFLLAGLTVQYQILTQGITLGSLMICLGVLAPFIVAVALLARSLWVGALLGMLTITFTIPMPVLDRLTPGLLLASLIFGVGLIHWMFERVPTTPLRPLAARGMLVVAAGILGRVLWDRPGSANLGETGGGAQAILYLVGGLSFVSMSMAASESWDFKRNGRLMASLAAMSSMINLGLEIWKPSTVGPLASIFSLPMWLLLPMLLAHIHESWPRRMAIVQWGLYLFVVAVTMGLAVATPFRSRPLFSLAMILAVALVYGHVRRGLAALAVVAVLGGALIATVSPSSIPQISRRALSTVLYVQPSEARDLATTYQISGEFGWQSDFRMALTRMAWDSIQRHPLLGKGFAFTAEELAWASTLMGGDGLDAGQMALVLSGAYHNTLLALAVFCGVPLALLFACGALLIAGGFFRRCRAMDNSSERVFAASLLGYFLVVTGQALMNGDGNTFLLMCVCLGVMNGMIARARHQAATATEP